VTETPAPSALPDRRVHRALLSVSDKTGLVDLGHGLAAAGVEIVSTGSTAAALQAAGVPVTPVAQVTGFPEVLDGRVKTLHPAVHVGLLADLRRPEHEAQLGELGIEAFELVVVNLYPFRETVAAGAAPQEVVEQIDIGGPAMVRAGAKNHASVAVVVDPARYGEVLTAVGAGGFTLAQRQSLAVAAFRHTASYDIAVASWLGNVLAPDDDGSGFPAWMAAEFIRADVLRYGENPHQRAALYAEVGARSHVLSRVAKQHGRALSFNNVLDLDSARKLLADLEGPACVIVKHNNPCGVAEGETILDAYEKALACDPLSAYGGVIALSDRVDRGLAERLHENFIEVLIAPGYDDDAMEVLRQKEAVRILEDTEKRAPSVELDVKRVRGGALVQEADSGRDDPASTEVAGATEPDEAQWRDLMFAWKVCRHVRSNAIVLAKDRATLGIGAGQMSRVDSVRIAVDKARDARGDDAAAALDGCVVASDAFFPFADGPQAAIDAGARAIIQPGGSKRDGEVIEACDAAGAAMAFTRRRHFRH